MLTCPYNPTHRVSDKRYQLHVIKCKKNYKGVPKEICPYNAVHVLDANKLVEHISNCPDRGPLDSLLRPSESKNTNMNRGYLGVPPYQTRTLVENQQESWSSDEEQPDRNSSYGNLPYSVFDLKTAVDECYKELMKTENQNKGHSSTEESLNDNSLENNPQHNSENKPAKKYPFIGIGRGAPLIQQNSPHACNRALSSGIGRGFSTFQLLDRSTSSSSLSSNNESMKKIPLENNSQKETKKMANIQLLGIGRGHKISHQGQSVENCSQVSSISHDPIPFLGIGRGYRLLPNLSNFNKESLNSSSLENDSQKETRSEESKNIPLLGLGRARGISLAKNNESYKSTGLQNTTTGCFFKSGIGRGYGLVLPD